MKAIAVPYIIAILLGVAVIGLIGYWLFVSGGQFGKGATEQSCRSDFLNWCNNWAVVGYDTDKLPGGEIFLGKNVPCQSFKDKLGTGITTVTSVPQHKSACGAPA